MNSDYGRVFSSSSFVLVYGETFFSPGIRKPIIVLLVD